jgi:protoporphyrinogen oxidase
MSSVLSNQKEIAPIVIIGAGPAGLTAAMELVRAGRRDLVIYEASSAIGGLSQTIEHHGNRIDIGGHRFFSKSDWVMNWWLDILPIAAADEPHSLKLDGKSPMLAYQGKRRSLTMPSAAPSDPDQVMLLRDRLSRILFSGKFFDYPLKLNYQTAAKLGFIRCAQFGLSYMKARLFPRRPEATLEDFFINRFGLRLYHRFFKDYTEKVWGRSCDSISAEWGAQRVKSLSIGKAVLHQIKRLFTSKQTLAAEQTSLIEHFLYPKFGPGQMWETVASMLRAEGVKIHMNAKITGLTLGPDGLNAVDVTRIDGASEHVPASTVISTMPVRELVAGMGNAVPTRVRDISAALEYRDFMTVGLLYDKLARSTTHQFADRASVPDNWIYIQEPGVKVGRVQIFNNWSPYMVADPGKVWIGLEFFCSEGDKLWTEQDDALIELAKNEISEIGIGRVEDCHDAVVVRMPKAYPGYYGAYEHFDEVRAFLDAIPNLFLIGRNGMHRYNNQDHSMLSARFAVEAILSGSTDKAPIWAVNIDDDYHESSES